MNWLGVLALGPSVDGFAAPESPQGESTLKKPIYPSFWAERPLWWVLWRSRYTHPDPHSCKLAVAACIPKQRFNQEALQFQAREFTGLQR